MKEGTEYDMRYLFCAASICYILNDWSGMDIESTKQFILSSIVNIMFLIKVFVIIKFVLLLVV